MDHSPLLRLLCMRNGESTDSETHCTLTPLGILQTKKAAIDFIVPWIKNNGIQKETLTLSSSEAKNAMETGQTIKEILKHTFGIKKRIRPISILNSVKWKGIPKSKEELDELLKIQVKIQERWVKHFAELIELARRDEIPRNRIIISHEEVFFFGILSNFFNISQFASSTPPLKHAETFELTVHENQPDVVVVSGKFRKLEGLCAFHLKEKNFMQIVPT